MHINIYDIYKQLLSGVPSSFKTHAIPLTYLVDVQLNTPTHISIYTDTYNLIAGTTSINIAYKGRVRAMYVPSLFTHLRISDEIKD